MRADYRTATGSGPLGAGSLGGGPLGAGPVGGAGSGELGDRWLRCTATVIEPRPSTTAASITSTPSTGTMASTRRSPHPARNAHQRFPGGRDHQAADEDRARRRSRCRR